MLKEPLSVDELLATRTLVCLHRVFRRFLFDWGFPKVVKLFFEALGGSRNVSLQSLEANELLVTGTLEDARVANKQLLLMGPVVEVEVAHHAQVLEQTRFALAYLPTLQTDVHRAELILGHLGLLRVVPLVLNVLLETAEVLVLIVANFASESLDLLAGPSFRNLHVRFGSVPPIRGIHVSR